MNGQLSNLFVDNSSPISLIDDAHEGRKEYLITVINNLTLDTSLDQAGSPAIDTPAYTYIITARAYILQLLLLHKRNCGLLED